jgi:hypothetical protein
MEQPQEHPPKQQANPRSRGRSSGTPNYRNDVLINIVKQQLPQGLEAWRNVACLYQNASKENELRRGEDIRDNWVRKLCNNFKKPTGKPGDLTDRIYRCRVQRVVYVKCVKEYNFFSRPKSGSSNLIQID